MKYSLFIIIYLFLLLSPFQKVSALNISAVSACIISGDTNQVIYEKNAYEKLPMASTTKIMTALLALKTASPDDLVTVSANAEGQEGSSIYLARGDKIRMEDLLYGLMLNSGNDAAVAIAEYISGNADSFASEMTALAHKIGAKNTFFKNPNGLDEEGHFTTAYDLAIIASYAMKNPEFRKIVGTIEKQSTINSNDILYFKNHNKLLKMLEGATGVKTGFTKKSGRCLVSAAERDGVELIGVTLNAPDDWNDHINMMDYAFSLSEKVSVLKKGEIIKNIYTDSQQEIGCAIKEDIDITVFGDKLPESEIITHLPKNIRAPIEKGEKIGEAEFWVNGRVYKKTDILSDRDIYKSAPDKSIRTIFFRVIKNLSKMYLQ